MRARLGYRPEWYGLTRAMMTLVNPDAQGDPNAAGTHAFCFSASYVAAQHDDGVFACTVAPLRDHTDTEQAAHNLYEALAFALAAELAGAVYREEAVKARHRREEAWEPPPCLYPRDAAAVDPAGEGPCLRLIPVAAE